MKTLLLIATAFYCFESYANTCGELLMQHDASAGLIMIEKAISKAQHNGQISNYWPATHAAARDEFRRIGTTYGYQELQRAVGKVCHEPSTQLDRIISYK
ncbi:MAG: hypothetical protein ACRCWB_11855 [Enterovibrio sp.]